MDPQLADLIRTALEPWIPAIGLALTLAALADVLLATIGLAIVLAAYLRRRWRLWRARRQLRKIIRRVYLTRAEFDALAVKDPRTMYVIEERPPASEPAPERIAP